MKGIKADLLPKGRHVDAGEIAALFRAFAATPRSRQGLGAARPAVRLRLRRSEAVALQLADYDAGAVTIRHGKGNKERIVYCPAGGTAAVDASFAAAPGRARCCARQEGRPRRAARAMTAQSVMMRVRFLAANAYVSHLAPHDLRRSFVGELLDAGGGTPGA